MIDALREQRDLNIGRACVPLVELEIVNRLRLCLHFLNYGYVFRFLIIVKL